MSISFLHLTKTSWILGVGTRERERERERERVKESKRVRVNKGGPQPALSHTEEAEVDVWTMRLDSSKLSYTPYQPRSYLSVGPEMTEEGEER